MIQTLTPKDLAQIELQRLKNELIIQTALRTTFIFEVSEKLRYTEAGLIARAITTSKILILEKLIKEKEQEIANYQYAKEII